MIDRETLQRLLVFDPLTGEFRRPGAAKPAGSIAKIGYRYISINRKKYLAHRLGWLWVHGVWPTAQIDHIDGNRSNNAISNLREANQAQNTRNGKLRSSNSSGYKGAHYHRGMGLWRARITVDGREIFLGHFNDPKSAHAAYVKAAREFFGEFARAA